MDITGWPAIGIPSDRAGIGMQVTGRDRRMLEHVGLVRATTVAATTRVAGVAKCKLKRNRHSRKLTAV